MGKFDLIDNFALIRGKSWNIPNNLLVIKYPSDLDLSSWTAEAIVRDNYKSLNGNAIVSFDFEPLIYDGEFLLIKPYLPLAKTQNLPVTPYQGDKNRLRLPNCFLWDLELTNSSQDIVISVIEASFVQIKDEVT
jgi:hypothetical protein